MWPAQPGPRFEFWLSHLDWLSLGFSLLGCQTPARGPGDSVRGRWRLTFGALLYVLQVQTCQPHGPRWGQTQGCPFQECGDCPGCRARRSGLAAGVGRVSVKTGRGEGPEPELGRGEVNGGAAEPRVPRASGGFVPTGQGSHQCPPELGCSFARSSAEHLPSDRLGAKYGVKHTGLNRGHLAYSPRREVVTTIEGQLLLTGGRAVVSRGTEPLCSVQSLPPPPGQHVP